MDPLDPGAAGLVNDVRRALAADEAGRVREILARHPELKAAIDAPLGPFDSPAIGNVRSRAMLDVLLEAGADINARSRWWAGGFGLLHSASPELAMYAIERGAIVDVHAAARLGLIDRLRGLVSADPALVHARGGDGQTPLHFASSVEVAAYLLEQGSQLDARDIDHESTPAQYMVRDRQEVARYLVSRGGATDLLMATTLGNADLVRRHLEADPGGIRMRVSDDWFPMINPRAGGTIYQWTLGFDVSAHQVARAFGHRDILELLLAHSPVDVRLIDACATGDASAARAILSIHPDIVAALSEADRRLVAHAARNNETTAVRLMLECGWSVDARGRHQATPLHWAAFHGNAELTQAILHFGPPLEVLDADFGGTPLGWAIHGSEHGWHSRTGDYGRTVEALLRAGATPPATVEGSQAVREALRRHA